MKTEQLKKTNPDLIDLDEQGKWFTLDEPYANPPWENLLVDFSEPIKAKNSLKIKELHAIKVDLDEESNLARIITTKNTFTLETHLYDFLRKLTLAHAGDLLVAYHPVILDNIIKLLGEDSVKSLALEGQVAWGAFKIFYTPNRNLSISFSNQRSVRIQPLYDWFSPADYEEFIEKYKKENETDLETLRLMGLNLLANISKAAKRTATSLASATAITDVYLEKPSQKIRKHTIPEEVYKLAYASFHAPWIEMIQTGRFRNLVEYDLNSAYPNEVGELLNIDSDHGQWVFETGTIPKDAYYGFVYAYMDIRDDIVVSPIFIRKQSKLFSAVGTWIGITTLEEINFIEEYELGRAIAISGWYFVPSVIQKPFKPFINKYLALKTNAIRNDEKLLQLILKSATVRFVGKFLQKTFEPLGGSFAIASPAFNSIYANIVMTRVKLNIARIALIKPEATVNIIVDGISATEELDLSSVKHLDFKKKITPDAILVNPHLLYYTKANRMTLLNIIKENPTQTWYEIPTKLRMRAFEALASNRFEDIGSIRSNGIVFEVGKDRKRFWPKPPEFGVDLLRYQFKSLPHNAATLDMMYPTFRDEEVFKAFKELGLHV